MQASSINEHRTPPELLQLDGVQSQHFRAGQTIHEPEDPANLFYLIESGEVRLYDVASGGTARLLEILGPDEWVGTAVLGQMPVYARRAVAVTDAVLWAIPALSLRKMLAEHGDVFKRGGHGAHDKFHGNPPGTRGNQLYRMVMRERRYQQSLLNIGIDLRKSTK